MIWDPFVISSLVSAIAWPVFGCVAIVATTRAAVAWRRIALEELREKLAREELIRSNES